MATLGSMSIGNSVYMNVGGVSTEFIVINHGQPTTNYGAACANATWLLMKNIYILKAWDSAGSTDYSLSSIHAYLNGEFIQLLDEDIRDITVEGKVMYRSGTSGATIKNGENGLSVRAFLLSYAEAGMSGASSATPLGVLLPYFDGLTTSQKIAYYNGKGYAWWLRSPMKYTAKILAVANGGGTRQDDCTVTNGIRPCLLIRSDAQVDGSGNVSAGGSSLGGFVKIGSEYRELSSGYVKIGSEYREITGSFKRIGGEYK